jgi:anti-anti-sigma factor
MLEIKREPQGRLVLSGRFDASQVAEARRHFDALTTTTEVDLGALEYVSSAGLGVLLAAQKALQASGHRLKLVNVGHHILDILHYSGFDRIFEISAKRP